MTPPDSPKLVAEAIVQQLAAALRLPLQQVRAAIELIDAGNTIPFIARYRKEATNGMDEIALRAVEDALETARDLAQRKATVLKTIDQQGALTPELRRQIDACTDLQTLEDLYLPYKPKRQTRAKLARERGLQPLAELLLHQKTLGRTRSDVLQTYVNPQQEVPNQQAALQGACDIVAEIWSEDIATRQWLAKHALSAGKIASQVKRGKKDADSKFAMYFEHTEPVSRIPSHRMLAMQRGEAEGILRVGLQLEDESLKAVLRNRLTTNPQFEFYEDLRTTVDDCYTRLLRPAIESQVIQSLVEKAGEEAITVFAKNLRELLLSAPAGPHATLGVDPGFRTGCKLAVVDGTGKFVEHAVIYPTPPRNDLQGAERIVLDLIERHSVRFIAVGNGTASRETDQFLAQLLREHQLDVTKAIVSESGASIYSASELAGREFPHLDATVRGAISIAHRLQDPLAELVKIDPKSIGVGQYQHDVNQSLLRKSLDREVESCVNSVGVDLNTASPSLLAYVSGIGPKLAEQIVHYRDAKGRFSSRSELLKVPKLGAKAFEQAAGFLRVRNGAQLLDDSAVHPESYAIVEGMARRLETPLGELVGNPSACSRLNPHDFVCDRAGLPTIRDILAELAKPGRDPRREFRTAAFAEGVQEMSDLQVGMILEGVITNVTRFGAFVDLGVHQDGLIHISQLADRYVQDPGDVVSVGDVVRVRILEVDQGRRRIAASMKEITT